MNAQFSLHNVKSARVVRRQNNGTCWLDITLTRAGGEDVQNVLFYDGDGPLDIIGDAVIPRAYPEPVAA